VDRQRQQIYVLPLLPQLREQGRYDGVGGGVVVNEPIAPNSVSQTPGIFPPRQFGVEIQWRPKFK
jgi:hypothetical protein